MIFFFRRDFECHCLKIVLFIKIISDIMMTSFTSDHQLKLDDLDRDKIADHKR